MIGPGAGVSISFSISWTSSVSLFLGWGTNLDDLPVNRARALAEQPVLDEHPVWVEFLYYWRCGL
jgi:hypothetical protein